MLIEVIKAFWLYSDDLTRQILLLKTGQAVYLDPGTDDKIFDSLEEAITLYSSPGNLEESEWLKIDWIDGYKIVS